eukprot:TRINITY_DN2341_c0_g1_i1.p1 TRINITY_DN2341_c0_g1~~TRINITY_DN2341_c0_g1_i1.p1  ORF type:complete len:411 (-),score=97.14 TRINITY_DN2341_c0_g1_i1:129-1361(-)
MISVLNLAILLLASLVALTKADIRMNCYPIVNWVVFDLNSLQKSDADYEVPITPATEPPSEIVWNICGYAKKVCNAKDSFANLFVGDNQCFHLTSPNTVLNVTYNLIDENQPESGLTITFDSGDDAQLDEKYSFTLNINCDANAESVQNMKYQQIGSKYIVDISTRAGCPKVNPSQISKFLQENKWILLVLCVALGSILTFVGFRLSKTTFFIFGFCITMIPILVIFFSFLITDKTSDGAKWGVIAFAAVISALCGYISVRLERVGFFLIGFGLAFVVTNIIFLAVIAPNVENNQTLIFMGIWLVIGLITGLSMAKFKDYVLILATSLFGSYLITRSSFTAFTDLPADLEIAKMIRLDGFKNFPGIVIAYLVVWFVIALIGLYIQFTKKRELDKKKEALLTPPAVAYYKI